MNNNITEYMEEKKNLLFGRMLRREDFEAKIRELKSASEIRRYDIISELVNMFGLINKDCRPDMDNRYYENLVKNTDLPVFSDVTGHIIRTIYENFEDYPKPEDFIKRIVDRCCDDNDGWNDQPLRLRILKQYIKYGNFSSYTKTDPKNPDKTKTVTVYSGKLYIKKYISAKTGKKSPSAEDILENLDDGIFELYEREKPDNGELLRLCENISKGVFKSGSSIKRDLYYFAMIFNMTYTVKDEAAAAPEKDIEKNLFTDYYNNNLMRFILKEYDVDDNALGGFELDPSGYGINYKNFTEMVYVYFISQSGYGPLEKMRRAEEMIDRLKKSSSSAQSGDTATRFFEYRFAKYDALNMPEEEFEKFLSENYECSDKGIKAMREQNTAANVLAELTEGLDPETCGQGLWFTEWNKTEEKATGNISSYLEDADSEKTDQFINLIYSIERFLTDSRKLADPDPASVTRTLIITAFYYKYMAEESDKNRGVKSFIDIYNDFTNTYTGLDYYLEEAGYQPVNSKNIFDITVMFGAYLYLNIFCDQSKAIM